MVYFLKPFRKVLSHYLDRPLCLFNRTEYTMSSIPKLPAKPKLNSRPGGDTEWLSGTQFDDFYSELEAWHKSVFEGATEVSIQSGVVHGMIYGPKTETINFAKGLLIRVQPVKEETAEDILKRWVACSQHDGTLISPEEIEKAKTLLERKK